MGDTYYYVAAGGAGAERSGFAFDESPVRLPHREMRDKARGDSTSDLYLMFDKPGAVLPTPPGTRLVRVPKPGLGTKPARAELLQQLEAYACLSTNPLLACTDAIILLANRLTQRVRFILSKCQEVADLRLSSLTGMVKNACMTEASYKSFLFYLNRRRSARTLTVLLPEEPFDEQGEFLAEDEEMEEAQQETGFLQVELSTEYVGASNYLAEVLKMADSSELVGRLFSLQPLPEEDNDAKVLFAHIVLLLAERDILASEDTLMQPTELRLKMFQFLNSSLKAERDCDSAHVFSTLFPLGFKAGDTFTTKEISLTTGMSLSNNFIESRHALLDNIQDGMRGLTAFPHACIPFKSLISLSLPYVEGGVALLAHTLDERKQKKRRQG